MTESHCPGDPGVRGLPAISSIKANKVAESEQVSEALPTISSIEAKVSSVANALKIVPVVCSLYKTQ